MPGKSKATEKSQDKSADARPKRPLSAYMLFAKEKREEVKRANPGLKPKEIVSELGRLWRECDEAEKSRYKAASAVNHERAGKLEEVKEEEKRPEAKPAVSKKPPKSPDPKKPKPIEDSDDEVKPKRGRRKC